MGRHQREVSGNFDEFLFGKSDIFTGRNDQFVDADTVIEGLIRYIDTGTVPCDIAELDIRIVTVSGFLTQKSTKQTTLNTLRLW